MTPKTNEEIVGALARGYCSKENEKKVLDSELIEAMAIEVEKLLSQKDKERVEAYKRGYVQGGFDAEMNRLNTPPTN